MKTQEPNQPTREATCTTEPESLGQGRKGVKQIKNATYNRSLKKIPGKKTTLDLMGMEKRTSRGPVLSEEWYVLYQLK